MFPQSNNRRYLCKKFSQTSHFCFGRSRGRVRDSDKMFLNLKIKPSLLIFIIVYGFIFVTFQHSWQSLETIKIQTARWGKCTPSIFNQGITMYLLKRINCTQHQADVGEGKSIRGQSLLLFARETFATFNFITFTTSWKQFFGSGIHEKTVIPK